MADLKMDKETRARFMSLMPCSTTGTYEWTPESFKEKVENEYVIPEDKWPTFILRPMTTKEHSSLRRILLTSGKVSQATPEQIANLSDTMYDAVRKLVVGWRGIIDMSTGDEFAFETQDDGTAKKDKFEFIPDTVKAEMFSHICRVGGLIKVDGEDRMKEVKRGL